MVKASVGHVRDLPKSELGVDEETFLPKYEVLEGKEKVVSELRAAAKKADTIYIASDPDREGEAIGWHVMNLLGGEPKKVRRILFHEITKNAVRKAIEHAGRDRHEQGQRPAGAPRSRPPGRLQALAPALGQGPPRSLRRPRAVGGA